MGKALHDKKLYTTLPRRPRGPCPGPSITYAQRPTRARRRAAQKALQLALAGQQPKDPLQPEPKVFAVQEPPDVRPHLPRAAAPRRRGPNPARPRPLPPPRPRAAAGAPSRPGRRRPSEHGGHRAGPGRPSHPAGSNSRPGSDRGHGTRRKCRLATGFPFPVALTGLGLSCSLPRRPPGRLLPRRAGRRCHCCPLIPG